MKPSTSRILAILKVLSWIAFFGLCVRTGAILYSGFVSLYVNPAGAKNLYAGFDLSSLFSYSTTHYSILIGLIVLISAMKAFTLYIIIKIFLKINYDNPFSVTVASSVSRLSYFTLGIGLLTLAGNMYCDWLTRQGVSFPPMQRMLGAGGEHLFFAGIIFFLAQIFKRGIEIQTENELTV